MGLTPLEGLLMGTRCGDIDASLPLFLMEQEGLSPSQMSDVLNKQSGLKALTGSNDMRDVESMIEKVIKTLFWQIIFSITASSNISAHTLPCLEKSTVFCLPAVSAKMLP